MGNLVSRTFSSYISKNENLFTKITESLLDKCQILYCYEKVLDIFCFFFYDRKTLTVGLHLSGINSSKDGL